MAATRYWRVVGIATGAGGDLEISELHLYGASGRVDAPATLTCSHAPIGGALASLRDEDTGTTCRFAGADVRSGGFVLLWDFGVGGSVDVARLRIASAGSNATFLLICVLQYSSDGASWVQAGEHTPVYPGPFGYAFLRLIDRYLDTIVLALNGGGADGSTVFTDSSQSHKVPSSIVGGAKISTAQSKYGGSSMSFSAGGWINYAAQVDFGFGNADFLIEFFVFRNVTGVQHSLIHFNPQLGSGPYPEVFINASGYLSYYANGGLRIVGATAIPAFAWRHGELSRVNGVTRLFLEGVQQGVSYTDSTNYGAGINRPIIGAGGYDQSTPFNGYLHLCIRKNYSGGHTSNFVPPETLEYFGPPAALASSAAGVDVAASSGLALPSIRAVQGLLLARDIEHGGPGTIYGTTKTKGTPANTATKARVVLLHQRSKQPVRETWSDPVTGAFAFTEIDTNQQFLTLAEDAAGNFRPVAANKLTPEVLP